jgi:iron(III) transport system substrate-binding protein
MQEASANLWIADVVHTSDISHFLDFKAKGMLAKHVPAGSDRFRPEFKDRDGFYAVLRGTPYVIAFNTQKVAKADAPRRWKDLLDPRWKELATRTRATAGWCDGIISLSPCGWWDYYAAVAEQPPVVQSAEDCR